MMKKKSEIFWLFAGAATATVFFMLPSLAAAHDQVTVLPIGGTVGNATAEDVVKDKTFSSRAAGKGVTGTRAPAPLSRTGRKTSVTQWDDGHLQTGVQWPTPRFTDNGDGTVTDNLTGLMWLKDADCVGTYHPELDTDGRADGQMSLEDALGVINVLNQPHLDLIHCGLSLPKKYTDWRMPNIREMLSLISYEYATPPLPNTSGTGQWTAGDPFTNVGSHNYWTSTFFFTIPDVAWYVNLDLGLTSKTSKSTPYDFWPVRGGQ